MGIVKKLVGINYYRMGSIQSQKDSGSEEDSETTLWRSRYFPSNEIVLHDYNDMELFNLLSDKHEEIEVRFVRHRLFLSILSFLSLRWCLSGRYLNPCHKP